MINKSVFENDLIAGMQRELGHSFEKKAALNDLTKVVDYLQAAAEIFEENGMSAKAEQVFKILEKIAAKHDSRVKEMPSMNALMGAGVTQEDLKNINDPTSKARVNTAFRSLGYTDREIKAYLGDKFMSEEDCAYILAEDSPYKKFMNWIQNPSTPVDPKNPQPGEDLSFKSIEMPQPGDTISFQSMMHGGGGQPAGKDELVFKSIASDDNDLRPPRRPKNPTKVSDSYNIPPLEMADADDFLDLDINEAAMELTELPQDKTFEDEDSQ